MTKSISKEIWDAAIGLQKVDGLSVSEYFLDLVKDNIKGNITIDEVEEKIESYYEAVDKRKIEDSSREADLVSKRISRLLNEETFCFSIGELVSVHRRLFAGIIKDAGKFRDKDISKKEWILNGDSVIYSSFESIEDNLKYDFDLERDFSYKGLSIEEVVNHITKFTSYIWQVHPFFEGNTRTISVFIVKYLRSKGFKANYELFLDNSYYLRNALVRSNYSNYNKNIFEDNIYLKHFFYNLIGSGNYILRNRDLHVDNENFIRLDNISCTLEEKSVLMLIKDNPFIKIKDISLATRKSERTIKNYINSLKNKGIIKRINGKRNGKWEFSI